MLKHIDQFKGISVKKYTNGIYYLIGDSFPMQLVITHELSPEEYYWLSHLRNNLKAGPEINDLAEHYGPHKHSKLYQAVFKTRKASLDARYGQIEKKWRRNSIFAKHYMNCLQMN